MATYCFDTLTINDFLKKIKQPNFEDLIKQEFAEVEFVPIEGTYDNYLKEENSSRNRYSDIPCWDHSRVILTSHVAEKHNYSDINSCDTIIVTLWDSDSTYIHANFVDGYEDSNKYICTQAPKKNTAGDLWRLIWQNNSRIIVSLTETDSDDDLCYEYWVSSEGYELVFCRYIVKTLEIEEEFGFKKTLLRLTDVTSRESRVITHFWYTNWPNNGIPANLKEFLTLLSKVNQKQEHLIKKAVHHNQPKPGPIVVHCSAGVGRTGTFCAIDNALVQLQKKKTVSVQNTILKIRRQRHSSVLMLEQYVFCYKVIEHILLNEQNYKDHL